MIAAALALALAVQAEQALPESYDALVARAVAEARSGQTQDAAASLDHAIAMDGSRPEAYVEQGGLHFLEKRYAQAARVLEKALALRDDAYARDLRASALLLDGRAEEAVREWNRLDRPRLRTITVHGLRHTRDRVARDEIVVAEGALLEADRLRETTRRLEETGLFDAVALRPTVVEGAPGTVDLVVDLAERHGLGSLAMVGARAAVDLTRQKVRLRYVNVAGAGISVGAELKWERTQPFLGVVVDMVRPFGLPANVQVEASRARPQYDLQTGEGGPFTLRRRGGELRLRRVIGPRTTAEVGIEGRERTFTVTRQDATPGTLLASWAGADVRVLDRRRHRADASLRVTRAGSLLGGDVVFTRALARAVYQATFDDEAGAALPARVFAAQVHLGAGTSGMPLDEMFAPGAASEMELPLRAHRQKRNGILGIAPIGRGLGLVNLEWRERLVRTPMAQGGIVFFYDGARVTERAQGGATTLHDLGVGVRLGLRRSLVGRVDFAHGLTDGKNTLTAGVGQAF